MALDEMKGFAKLFSVPHFIAIYPMVILLYRHFTQDNKWEPHVGTEKKKFGKCSSSRTGITEVVRRHRLGTINVKKCQENPSNG